MPLVAGVPVYLYPTPLHYRIIPELVSDREPALEHDSSTNALIRRYRGVKS